MSQELEIVPTQEGVSKAGGDGGIEGSSSGKKHFCSLRTTPARIFKPGVTPARERLINMLSNKWVTGTVLHYYFFDREADGVEVVLEDGRTEFRGWAGDVRQMDVVQRAFGVWANENIGVRFEEVDNREEAEIRIGFMRGDGAWSWLGRQILEHGPNERTMNFGWNLTGPGEIDTAVHEIGHTLGFPHEHQNPKAGIEWDEEAVYASLAEPPNLWDKNTTFWNIIRKLDAKEVDGTVWDPDSIMHYPFEAGLIKKPEKYSIGLQPKGGLSAKDRTWVKALYPPTNDHAADQLRPAQSVLLEILPGQQRDFLIEPEETRSYEFRTFGSSDSVMVLFENDNGKLSYRTGDDDSGEEQNATFKVRLTRGHRYVLRVRLYHADRRDQTAVMMW